MQNEDFYVCRDCHKKLHVSTSVKDATRKRGIMERCKPCDRKRKQSYRDDPVSGEKQRIKVRDAMRAQRRERKAAGQHWGDSLTDEQLEQRRVQMRKYSRESRWRKLGITPELYDATFAEQNGLCSICGSDTPKRGKGQDEVFSFDHDHVTGQLRGLLCVDCNLMIGHANDDPERLAKGIAYLARWGIQGHRDDL